MLEVAENDLLLLRRLSLAESDQASVWCLFCLSFLPVEYTHTDSPWGSIDDRPLMIRRRIRHQWTVSSVPTCDCAVCRPGVLDIEHVLPARRGGDTWPGGRDEASHQLLSVGAGRTARAGDALPHPVRLLACLQRPLRHQHQQPRRGGRDHPERALPGETREDHSLHDPPPRPLPRLPAGLPRRR